MVDSWAWMEYLAGSKLGRTARQRIEAGEILTCAVSLAEIASNLSRKKEDYATAIERIVSQSKIIVLDRTNAPDVGVIHSDIKAMSPNFSLADAIILETARRFDARVLTGDMDFEGVKEAELLL